ncbi:hypothetical protein [Gymnodinialimonas ulvae]|uniref:hypothetical protein n=1 Tax=Gymnodinialimonas ulvae TaxID=3126504 RepID=UPI0030A6673C
MCYGHVDAKVLEREVQDRLRAAQRAPHDTAPEGLPPELMGGLRGVFARVSAVLSKARRKPSVT